MIRIIPPSSDDIVCPFCQKTICLASEKAEESDWIFDAKRDICEHTLFVATSEGGFEYRSSRFNKAMNLPDDQKPMPDLPPSSADPQCDMEINEFTSLVPLPGSVKMTSTEDHAWGIDVYAGFAP